MNQSKQLHRDFDRPGPPAEIKSKNNYLKQLFDVYEDLSFSSTPHFPEKNQKGNSSSAQHNEAKKALDEALAAEKIAEQARAKANALMKRSSQMSKSHTGMKRPLQKSSGKGSGERSSSQDSEKNVKKKRYTWSEDLHRRFLATIFDIGLRQAKPKLLLELLQPPPGLTTEHIKSHLQKYRKNCKKTRELFMAQFDIAKEQATSNHDGKAINPGFHAYPMPVGRFPLKLPDSDDPKRTKFQLTNTTYTVSSDVNESSTSKGEDKVLYDEEGRRVFVPRKECYYIDVKPPKKTDSTTSQNKTARPQQKRGEWTDDYLSPHTLELFKQMEAQVQIHNQIQERHKLQREQHFTGKETSSKDTVAREPSSLHQGNEEAVGENDFVFGSSLLTGNNEDTNQSLQLGLEQNMQQEDNDFLFDFLNN